MNVTYFETRNKIEHMKNIIIILIFLVGYFAFSQKAKITYIASTSNYTEDLKKDKKLNILVDTNTFSSDIEFELFINNNKSYYKKQESLEVESKSINLTTVFAGKGIFYYDIKNKKILNKKSNKLGAFLIEHEKINWKLINETKKIGKYTCLKATASVLRKHLNDYNERKIIAWYTPEISLSFGPKYFNGLPGLILSLQEGDKLYLVAKTIYLNPKEEIIIPELPKDFEKITLKEYEKRGSKRFEDFRKKRKRRN